MRPPSSGGIGNKLNTANTTLMISAFFKFSAAHCAAFTGRYPTRWNASAAKMASAMFMAGPATATQTMPLRGFRSARKLTGTGLAYPNRNGEPSEAGQQDRPSRIDVLQGIKAHPSQPPCRLIAEETRDEAMGRLMKSNGYN